MVEFDEKVMWQGDLSKLDSPITEVNNTYLVVEGTYRKRLGDYPGAFGGKMYVTRVILSRSLN